MNRRASTILAVVVLLGAAIFSGVFSAVRKNLPSALEGAWSAPSLSNPQAPIIFQLLPDGKATEQIGDYRGVGTWKNEAGSARILWASGWVGLLQPTTQGTYELLTWKTATSSTSRPDDIQPATRISPP